MRDLAILTAGGHAIDVGALAAGFGWHPVFFDDSPTIGDHSRWRDRKSPLPMFAYVPPAPAIIGHNDPKVRAFIAARFPGAEWRSIMCEEPQDYEPGCVVAPGAVITERVKFGAHVHVNVGATVSQSTTVGSYCTISPGAHICGDVTIGQSTWIGAGVIVKDHVRIGSGVTVGAGAVVIDDIPDNVTVVGVPARELVRS